MQLDANTLLTAVVGMVGLILGAVLSELRSWLAERRAGSRATEAAVAAWRRDSLRDTRDALRRNLAALEAIVLGDEETAKRHELLAEGLDSNIALVGDVVAIRAYQAIVTELRRRFGKGLPPAYAVRSAKAMNLIYSALDEQEERLLRGKPLARVDPSLAPDLFAPESLAARIDVPWRLPSLWALQARYWLKVLGWLDRRVRRR
jgi:hypothetical protein